VSKNDSHSGFLDKVKLIYSSSANKTSEKFDKNLSEKIADVIIYNNKEFKELSGSEIYKITNSKIIRMR